MQIKEEIKNLYKNSNKKLNLTIFFTTIILFVYCYFGSFSFFERHFTNCKNLDYWKIIYHNFSSFILFFIGGLIFSRFVLKESFEKVGLKIKHSKLMLKIMVLGIMIIPLISLLSLISEQMRLTYPLINFNDYSWFLILNYFISYFLYYLGWEFLFRGLLLNIIEQANGTLTSILITTLISSLIHTSIAGFGKPMLETLSAIPAGFIFGYISCKTENIYASLYCHTAIGFFTDLLIFLIVY